MTVTGVENNGANTISYKLSSTILDLVADSKVYFLQGAENNQYEIIFGDNVVGRKPKDGSIVIVTYLESAGSAANNISDFMLVGKIDDKSYGMIAYVKDPISLT